VVEDLPPVETEEEKEAKWKDSMTTKIQNLRSIWTGVYSGIYGKKERKNGVPKPSEECFGDWIMEDIVGIRNFMKAFKKDMFGISMKDAEFAWYSAGDLMFKNEEVCHFRMVY